MSDPGRDDVLDDGSQAEGSMSPRAQHRAQQRKGRPTAGSRLWAGVREIALIAATALVISFVIKTFIAQAFWIPSGSMENTLVYGDRVMVSKIQVGPMKVERGDIAVFEDPGGWLNPPAQVDRGPVAEAVVKALEFIGVAPVAEGNHLIKRVIGVGGDVVVCCNEDGRLTVNGHPLEEPYLNPGDVPSAEEFEITVPEDKVWFMGDHRSNSRDSRANDDGTGLTGSVPRENVVGQAFVLLFPLDRITWFEKPETFDEVPESSSQP